MAGLPRFFGRPATFSDWNRGFAEMRKAPDKAQDYIRLDLPWGDVRNFFVPAGDPRDPVFHISSAAERVARELAAEAAARGVSFATVGFDREENAITLDKLKYETVYR